MSDLNKAVFAGFDRLAAEVRQYDDVTEGGIYLIGSDQFNNVAKEKLSPEQRDHAFEAAKAIHSFLKAADVTAWWQWFGKDHGGTTPREKLDATLTAARQILARTNFERVARLPGLPAHFFDRAARTADDLLAEPAPK